MYFKYGKQCLVSYYYFLVNVQMLYIKLFLLFLRGCLIWIYSIVIYSILYKYVVNLTFYTRNTIPI